MKTVVFTSLGAPYFAKYIAEKTQQAFCDYHMVPRAVNMRHNLFVIGLYRPQWPQTKDWFSTINPAKLVLMFAGADITELLDLPAEARNEWFQCIYARGGAFATESPITQAYIQRIFNLDSTITYLPSKHNFPTEPYPLPKDFTVGCYMPYQRRAFYAHPIIANVIRAMPDVRFHFYCTYGYDPLDEEKEIPNLTTHGYEIIDMPNFLKDVSCGLRITAHDTYAMSAIDYNLAGRWFLNNHEMPFCEKLSYRPTVDEIVKKLREVQQRPGYNVEGHREYTKLHNIDAFLATLGKLFD